MVGWKAAFAGARAWACATICATICTGASWGGAPEAVAGDAGDVMAKWSRSCALCHVTGNGGAPRVGHAEEWQARVRQGREVLLDHTVEGFNSMPPLGYCMSCEREDYLALIDFMVGDAGPVPPQRADGEAP